MEPRTFRHLGRLATGRTDWQGELARLLGVSPRTIRRWAAGTKPVPADIIARMQALRIEAGR